MFKKLVLILFLLISLSAVVIADLSSDLIAVYHLDNSSGENALGTGLGLDIHGTVLFSSPALYPVDATSPFFDGTDNYYPMFNLTGYDIPEQHTICMYINYTDGTYPVGYIFDTYDVNNYDTITILENGDLLSFSKDGATNLHCENPPVNEWAYYCVATNSTYFGVYKNGVLINSSEGDYSAYTGVGSNYITFGDWGNTNKIVFDEILLWGRTLSDAEILESYNNFYPFIPVSPQNTSVWNTTYSSISGFGEWRRINATVPYSGTLDSISIRLGSHTVQNDNVQLELIKDNVSYFSDNLQNVSVVSADNTSYYTFSFVSSNINMIKGETLTFQKYGDLDVWMPFVNSPVDGGWNSDAYYYYVPGDYWVYWGVPPVTYYTIDGCKEFENSTVISTDLTLTDGCVYNVYNLDFANDDITLDCNGATINASGNEVAHITNRDGITIKNCIFTDVSNVIQLDKSNYFVFDNNIVTRFQRGVWGTTNNSIFKNNYFKVEGADPNQYLGVFGSFGLNANNITIDNNYVDGSNFQSNGIGVNIFSFEACGDGNCEPLSGLTITNNQIYNFDGTNQWVGCIDIINYNDIYIDGNTIDNITQKTNGIIIQNSTNNVIISNNNIRVGNGDISANNGAIDFFNFNGGFETITNVKIHNNHLVGDKIGIDMSSDYYLYVNNINITNNYIEIYSLNDNTLGIYNYGASGFHEIYNLLIYNNTLKHNTPANNNVISLYGGVDNAVLENINISFNTIENGRSGIVIWFAKNNVVLQNNNIVNSQDNGIILKGSNATIIDNIIENVTNYNGIDFESPYYNNATILRNTIINSYQNGIIVKNGDAIIQDNNVSGINQYWGMYFENSLTTDIENNNVDNTLGINCPSGQCTIINNRITNGNSLGLYAIYVNPDNAIISNNYIENPCVGIGIEGDNSIITNNIIVGVSTTGFACTSSGHAGIRLYNGINNALVQNNTVEADSQPLLMATALDNINILDNTFFGNISLSDNGGYWNQYTNIRHLNFLRNTLNGYMYFMGAENLEGREMSSLWSDNFYEDNLTDGWKMNDKDWNTYGYFTEDMSGQARWDKVEFYSPQYTHFLVQVSAQNSNGDLSCNGYIYFWNNTLGDWSPINDVLTGDENVIKTTTNAYRIYYIPTADIYNDGNYYYVNVSIFGSSSTMFGCQLQVYDVGFRPTLDNNIDGASFWYMQDNNWGTEGVFIDGTQGTASFNYIINNLTYLSSTLRTAIHVKGSNTGFCNTAVSFFNWTAMDWSVLCSVDDNRDSDVCDGLNVPINDLPPYGSDKLFSVKITGGEQWGVCRTGITETKLENHLEQYPYNISHWEIKDNIIDGGIKIDYYNVEEGTVIIANNSITNGILYGNKWFTGINVQHMSNIKIISNNITSTEIGILAVGELSNLTIDSNRITQLQFKSSDISHDRVWGIHILPSDGSIYNVNITNNLIDAGMLDLPSSKKQLGAIGEHCCFTGTADSVNYNVEISNNQINNFGENSLSELGGIFGLTIKNNRFENLSSDNPSSESKLAFGLRMAGLDDLIIENNSFVNVDHAIYLSGDRENGAEYPIHTNLHASITNNYINSLWRGITIPGISNLQYSNATSINITNNEIRARNRGLTFFYYESETDDGINIKNNNITTAFGMQIITRNATFIKNNNLSINNVWTGNSGYIAMRLGLTKNALIEDNNIDIQAIMDKNLYGMYFIEGSLNNISVNRNKINMHNSEFTGISSASEIYGIYVNTPVTSGSMLGPSRNLIIKDNNISNVGSNKTNNNHIALKFIGLGNTVIENNTLQNNIGADMYFWDNNGATIEIKNNTMSGGDKNYGAYMMQGNFSAHHNIIEGGFNEGFACGWQCNGTVTYNNIKNGVNGLTNGFNYALYSSHNTISNTSYGILNFLVDTYALNPIAPDNIVENNEIYNVSTGIKIGYGGVGIFNKNVVVRNNKLRNLTSEGIFVVDSNGVSLLNNEIYYTAKYAINVSNVDNILIDGNTIDVALGGISQSNSRNVNILTNIIRNLLNYSIQLIGTVNSTITNNTMENTTNIALENTSNTEIVTNTITNNAGSGTSSSSAVTVTQSSNVTITNNTANLQTNQVISGDATVNNITSGGNSITTQYTVTPVTNFQSNYINTDIVTDINNTGAGLSIDVTQSNGSGIVSTYTYTEPPQPVTNFVVPDKPSDAVSFTIKYVDVFIAPTIVNTVTLSIDYNRGSLPPTLVESTLAIYVYYEGVWVKGSNTVVDTANQKVYGTFPASYFTGSPVVLGGIDIAGPLYLQIQNNLLYILGSFGLIAIILGALFLVLVIKGEGSINTGEIILSIIVIAAGFVILISVMVNILLQFNIV